LNTEVNDRDNDNDYTNILTDIPKSAEVILGMVINNIAIQFLQTPVDMKRKTGVYYCHTCSQPLEECATFRIVLTKDDIAVDPDFKTLAMQFLALYLKIIVARREDEMKKVH